MKERTENPNQVIVQDCCKKCPLLASKPGHEKFPQHVLAAADSASRLKKLVDGKLVDIIFDNPNDLKSKRVAAYFGYLLAENRSDRKRFPKSDETSKQKNNIKFKESDYF